MTATASSGETGDGTGGATDPVTSSTTGTTEIAVTTEIADTTEGTVTAASSGESGTSGVGETGATTCAPTVWYLDADKDGHGDPKATQLACDPPRGHVEVGDDCDDANGARAPSLPELCDGQDNDCDALVDEYSAVNDYCKGCTLTAIGASSYAHCELERTYTDARLECQGRGGDLTVIQDQQENDILAKYGVILDGDASQWYIGINDMAAEGDFVWLDGDPVGVFLWAKGEPSNTDDEDCGVMLAGSGTWNDGKCSLGKFFICEGVNGP